MVGNDKYIAQVAEAAFAILCGNPGIYAEQLQAKLEKAFPYVAVQDRSDGHRIGYQRFWRDGETLWLAKQGGGDEPHQS